MFARRWRPPTVSLSPTAARYRMDAKAFGPRRPTSESSEAVRGSQVTLHPPAAGDGASRGHSLGGLALEAMSYRRALSFTLVVKASRRDDYAVHL